MKQPFAIIVQLVHIHGPMKGEIQEFSGNEITIGRHPSCDLQFSRDIVVISRNHASIIREGNRFKIVDHSTNGTFVNGKRITETYLKNGDVILFTQDGPKVSFLTRIDEDADVNREQSDTRMNTQHESGYSAPERPSRSIPVPPPVPPEAAPQPTRSAPQPVYQPVKQAHHPPVKIERVKAPLIVQYGPVLKSFNELPVTIGTLADCDLTLEHPSLLELHIQIFFSEGSYRVKDITGRNQVLINNQPIISPSALRPGDRLFLTATGPAFQFLEGGRMAEINIPHQEVHENIEDVTPHKKEALNKKKTGSLFKKIFH